MRILVTGGAGFIGANFVRYWLEEHPDDRVVVYDLLTYAGNRASLADVDERIGFVEGDIADAERAARALADERIETIVNFAAESHNSLAVLDPGRFFRTNVLGTQTLLEAARAAGIGRFHHVSTCEVYGDLPLDSGEAFTEESPYRPRTPYNASKAGADHCRAIDLVLREGRPGETYNVGSRLEASIEELADRILAVLDKPASLKTIVPDRPGHDRRYLLDASKIERELGWRPSVDFGAGLEETVRWYAGNRDWWEPLKRRAPVEETAWR